MFIPLLFLNPHHLKRETTWSRWLGGGTAIVLLIANQIALAQLVFLLVTQRSDGPGLLLAAVQVWVTNVIAFALVYWEMDRGGPVARRLQPRQEVKLADFRFPQDEDHDAIDEVRGRSSEESRLDARLYRLPVLLGVGLDGVQPDRRDAAQPSRQAADGCSRRSRAS